MIAAILILGGLLAVIIGGGWLGVLAIAGLLAAAWAFDRIFNRAGRG